ncbi:MAG: hypothetical protein U5P10_13690 [Spirochaetia bacterium]|nr:hypothetical protein [Spirochaetia bacterium]
MGADTSTISKHLTILRKCRPGAQRKKRYHRILQPRLQLSRSSFSRGRKPS